MRVLTAAAEIDEELTRLIKGCTTCQIAVAWAGVGFDTFGLLTKHQKKIGRMVVGTHFYQTHPQFIEAFLAEPAVRFVMKPEGVFHPKLYLFEMGVRSGWECVIGSPNFTRGGVGTNDEVAALASSRDAGAADALRRMKEVLDRYWRRATRLTHDEFLAYREVWDRKQPALRSVGGRFGNPDQSDGDDRGHAVPDVPLLRSTWATFYKGVCAEQEHGSHGNSLEGRLKVMRVVRLLFASHGRFKDMDREDRRKVAGLEVKGGVFYLWFGSMRGNGTFQQAVNLNAKHLSLALAAIPSTGRVLRADYMKYVELYRKAFPKGRAGIATATRLLAMKRPDTFVCLDKRNKQALCRALGISMAVNYQSYWDSIVERVTQAAWWCSRPPDSGVEREVWEARAAFLDSLFYDGLDMPNS